MYAAGGVLSGGAADDGRIPLAPLPIRLHNLRDFADPGLRTAAVFLSEPAETAADIRFWLFGTHVRISPWFWLVSALLGWNRVMDGDTRTGLLYLAIWMLCMLVSILLHEFGHIWMGRLFGSHGHVVLHGFGGLAIGSNSLNRSWQRFLVSFAGPLIQLAFFGLLVLVAFFLLPAVPEAWLKPTAITLSFLIEINLFWPILNLFPIWPLDGGQMCREVSTALAPRTGLYVSLVISAVTAGLLALYCLVPEFVGRYVPLPNIGRQPYMAIFFGLFCVQSIMALSALNAARRRRYDDDDQFPWER